MIPLNFPEYPFKFGTASTKPNIYDVIRRKYVPLTPEEWVRQHVIQWLMQEKQVPPGLMAVETGLNYNGLQKRADLLVYGRNGAPVLLVECKAPHVQLDEKAFSQIAIYNMNFKVKYLLVTNGLLHVNALIDHEARSYSFMPETPGYDTLNSI